MVSFVPLVLLFSTLLTSVCALDLRSGGTYLITNAKAGTALDLSAFDNTSVIGWPLHGASNQQWTLEWQTRGWAVRNGHTNTYLALDTSPGPLRNGTLLVASPQTSRMEWHIWADGPEENAVFRVYVPNTTYNWDLFGHGNQTPGTPVQLWQRWGGVHQTWKFVPT